MMKKIGGLENTKNKVWGMLQNVTSMYEDSIEAILTGVQLVDGKRSVFVRDFLPSGLAFLMNREPEIVKNFILKTLRSWEKKIDRFPGEVVLPASFKVHHNSAKNKDTMEADFCETATDSFKGDGRRCKLAIRISYHFHQQASRGKEKWKVRASISGKGELKSHDTTIVGLLLSRDNTIVIAADGRKAYESENKGLEVQNDETIKLCDFGKTFVISLAGCAKVCKNLQFRLRMMKKIGGLEDTKNKVFVRDFIPNGLAFLMNREREIVKNFNLKTLRSWEKKIDKFFGEGVLLASFKVRHDSAKNKDTMEADFCETTTDRVAPVHYGFWWIFLLRAYTRSTGDTTLPELPECQMAMQLILSLCLSEGFNTFQNLLCTDGCSMIEREMIGGLEDTKNKVWGMLQNVTSMYEDSIEAILTGVQLVDGKRSVFVRDFIPSGLAFLMNREPGIVKNFIPWEKKIDRFPGEGVLPASFKVHHDSAKNKDTMEADFCETATDRFTPVDYGFWWIFLLRAYTRSTGDTMLAELPECQMAMQLILSLCLSEGFNTFPTLLCTDGCSMIERQMILSKEMAEDASLQSELITTSINKHLGERKTGKPGGVISGK
ncbi:Probable alkaline/neutral invertase B [Linum perenne]